MKTVAGIALALVVATCGVLPAPARGAEAPVEIDVVLSLTGPAAFLGSKEAQALGIAEKMVNQDGGVRGRLIKFVIHDDGTSPQNTVQITNALIAKKAALVIGPSVVAACSAMLPIVDANGPVAYCLAPPVQPRAGSYMFSQGNTMHDWIVTTLRACRVHKWNKIALITATDASGQTYDKEFEAVFAGPEGRGLEIVDRQHFNVADISMAAQIAHMKSAGPTAVLSFTVGPAFGTLLRELNATGMDPAVFGSAGNLNFAQLESYKAFVPRELYFAASGGGALDPNASPAVRAAQAKFFKSFAEAGVRVEFLHTTAWDPAMLYVDALRKLGPDANARQVHEYIEGLRRWTGILGHYDFAANSQRGVASNTVRLYRWDAAKGELTNVPF
jgi:branched-chain amino acid transport system substrate-binding protein